MDHKKKREADSISFIKRQKSEDPTAVSLSLISSPAEREEPSQEEREPERKDLRETERGDKAREKEREREEDQPESEEGMMATAQIDAELHQPRGADAVLTPMKVTEELFSAPSSISYGVFKTQGRREYMEDRHVAVPKVLANEERSPGLFAVFDGHAGSEAAQYAARRLPQVVREILSPKMGEEREREGLSGLDLVKTLEESLSAIEAELLGKEEKEGEKEKEIVDGTTALCLLLTRQRAFIANVGDSRAVLIERERAMRLSVDHKPNHEKEKDRIESHGGMVIKYGVWRVAHPAVNSVLAMSRSLGDPKFKEKLSEGPVVSSLPTITSVKLREGDLCIILASDGVWDAVSDEDARELVLQCFSSTSAGEREGGGRERERGPSAAQCHQAAKMLTEEALKRGSTDNITAIVIGLQP